MITCSNIGFGNQLGAQMTNFADLYYIACENNQELILLGEFKDFRRGYQFVEAFDFPDNFILKGNRRGLFYNSLLSSKSGNWKKNYKKIYKNRIIRTLDGIYYKLNMNKYHSLIKMSGLKSGITCDEKLLRLDNNGNYDILDGYGTIKEWDKYGDNIRKIFKFKEETLSQGDSIWKVIVCPMLNDTINQTCSIHFRRTDYLLMSSLCLTDDYYIEAIKEFDKDKTLFVVFSDDIEYAKNVEYLKELNVVFMDNNPAIMDMYLMSKCDNNIIANSSFSFWGAYLNSNKSKKVVCPHDFIGESAPDVMYMNGNWYPDDWIALETR